MNALVPHTDGAIVLPTGCREDALAYVCDEISAGRRLEEICTEDELPSHGVVRRWLQQNEAFRRQYIDAYKVFLTLEATNILDIADSEGEDVKRDTLRINTRVKMLEKFAPDEFGDRDQTGDFSRELFAFIRVAQGSK